MDCKQKARKFYKGAKAVKTAYNVVKKNRSVSKPKTRKRTSSGKPSGKSTAGFGTFFRIVNKPPRKSPYNILKIEMDVITSTKKHKVKFV